MMTLPSNVLARQDCTPVQSKTEKGKEEEEEERDRGKEIEG